MAHGDIIPSKKEHVTEKKSCTEEIDLLNQALDILTSEIDLMRGYLAPALKSGMDKPPSDVAPPADGSSLSRALQNANWKLRDLAKELSEMGKDVDL